MKKERLMQEIFLSNNLLESIERSKKELERQPVVKNYLQEIKNLEDEKNRIQFLMSLEVGEDGSVFSPYERYRIPAFSRMHYGLTEVLRHAFALKLQSLEEEAKTFAVGMDLTYQEVDAYIRNVNEKLRSYHYIEGDLEYENPYDYTIYQNPRNYSVVNPQVLWTDGKKYSYPIASYGIRDNWEQEHFHFAGFLDTLDVPSSLTPREHEAFYGKEARKILGIPLKKEKTMVKKDVK